MGKSCPLLPKGMAKAELGRRPGVPHWGDFLSLLKAIGCAGGVERPHWEHQMVGLTEDGVEGEDQGGHGSRTTPRSKGLLSRRGL